MLRCGLTPIRDQVATSAPTRITCVEMMIIVESSLPKAVASTGSKCDKGVRVRTMHTL
jgi:hypothetical protein